MDQLEAMQEDRDNWNNEEMLEAAVQLINLDSVICRAVGLVVPVPLP